MPEKKPTSPNQERGEWRPEPPPEFEAEKQQAPPPEQEPPGRKAQEPPSAPEAPQREGSTQTIEGLIRGDVEDLVEQMAKGIRETAENSSLSSEQASALEKAIAERKKQENG